MATDTQQDIRHKSRVVVDGPDRAPARSMLRAVGLKDEDFDKVISVKIGRYGVYIQGLETNTTLPDEYIPSEINFNKASESLKKKNDGPLKICNHPESGEPILLKNGRYGQYVTDGKINATLPKTISLDDITLESAIHIILKKKTKNK